MMLGRCCHCEPAAPIPPRLFEVRRLYYLGQEATVSSVPAHNLAWTFNNIGDNEWDAVLDGATWDTLPISDPGPPEIRTARWQPWEHTIGFRTYTPGEGDIATKFAEDKTETRRDGDFALPANAHCWPLDLSSISVGVPFLEWTGFSGFATSFLDYVEILIDDGSTHQELIDLTAAPPSWGSFAKPSNPARGIDNFTAALAGTIGVPDNQVIKMRFYLRSECERLVSRTLARATVEAFSAYNGGAGGRWWGVTGFNSCNANAQRNEGDIFQLTFGDNPPGGVSPLRLEPQTGWNYSTDDGTILMDHIATGDAVRLDWERETLELAITMPGAPPVPGFTQQLKYVTADSGQYRIPVFSGNNRNPKSQYQYGVSTALLAYGRGNANDPQGSWFLGTSDGQINGGFPSTVTLDVVT